MIQAVLLHRTGPDLSVTLNREDNFSRKSAKRCFFKILNAHFESLRPEANFVLSFLCSPTQTETNSKLLPVWKLGSGSTDATFERVLLPPAADYAASCRYKSFSGTLRASTAPFRWLIRGILSSSGCIRDELRGDLMFSCGGTWQSASSVNKAIPGFLWFLPSRRGNHPSETTLILN